MVAGVCLLWNIILFLFLASSDNGASAVICAAAGIFGSGFMYISIRAVMDRFLPLDMQKRRIIFTVGAFAVCLAVMLSAPYSPAHDSHDMSAFLSTFLKGTTLSDYADKYLSFYGTNRICMYFYKPFVMLTGSVRTGSTISNIIFLLTAVLSVSDIIYKRYGMRNGEAALFLMPAFVPYMMMSGPYIYPPAIFLSAVALCLYFSQSVKKKILSAVFFGVLMVMRPTSAMFWVIFVIAKLVLKSGKDIINRICLAIVLVLLAMCTQTAFGNYLYKTGAYPYPQFTNSAMQWTLELGLRPQGTETGKCTYSAISGVPFDEISGVFSDLWEAYDGADDNETYRIHLLNKKLETMIWERAKNTVLSDFGSFAKHIKTKYINMFSDEYKAYYYAANIPDEKFGENLYKNYEWRYFLSENVILAAFALACVILCGVVLIDTLRHDRRDMSVLLGAALAVMAVLCGFVLLTEVGKRLIFDLYIPMCIIICAVYSRAINKLRVKIAPDARNIALSGVICVLSVCVVQVMYCMYNLEIFRGCTVSYNEKDRVVISLKEPVEEYGYMMWTPDGDDISLYGRQHISLMLEKHDRQIIELTIPDGEIIVLTNYEQK